MVWNNTNQLWARFKTTKAQYRDRGGVIYVNVYKSVDWGVGRSVGYGIGRGVGDKVYINIGA